MLCRRPLILAALASSVLLAACLGAGARGNPFERNPGGDGVTVHVTNLAFMDATLYAVTAGIRRRLGRVSGERDYTFTLPLATPTELWLEIDILAGPRCFTERVTVEPGNELEITIQNQNPGWYCEGR